MRTAVVVLLSAAALLSLTCGEWNYSTLVLTAQVAKTLDPESNTATILLAKTTIANLFHDDWMETPDPGDSVFSPDVFPVKVTPVSGATVTLNSTTVPANPVPGVYFLAAADLEHLARYDLDIVTQDGKHVTARGFLPDSFSILAPQPGDSFGPGPVSAVWTRADSAQTYVVGITPADTASTAQGWADSRTDTSCAIPASAFQDSLGTFIPGDYVFSVSAVNGGWNKSGLDLFLSGGNVSGALGVFGCAVHPKPVLIRVR
ncbi:hypothetical protein FJY71_08365 [candidate division WOR-3 bacterium]|nr:hypothetical protein [candidate division WOR-3 bacterium]